LLVDFKRFRNKNMFRIYQKSLKFDRLIRRNNETTWRKFFRPLSSSSLPTENGTSLTVLINFKFSSITKFQF
jgi:hypothetical protein